MKDMAIRTALVDLYEFIYAVSSDCVHFNPRIIVRNAWGDGKCSFEHSTKNFEDYYSALCKVYGIYLLSFFLREFSQELGLSPDTQPLIDSLSIKLSRELRWPEAVTYEEMNKPGPTDADRVLMRAMHTAKQTDA